jgi:hypothetical protein
MNKELRGSGFHYTTHLITPPPLPARSERAIASEPRDRSAPAERRARERAGESEGRSPLDKISANLAWPAFVQGTI